MGTRVYQLAGGPPSTLGNQSWTPGSVARFETTQQSVYLAPPNTPGLAADGSVFDDEFNDGSPDLAARGWTFVCQDNGLPMTRVGNVYPYEWTWKGGVGALTLNQYRSTIVNGRLAVQMPSVGGSWWICKRVTLPTTTPQHGGLLWARFGATRPLDTAGQAGWTNINFWGNVGAPGIPDPANRLFHEILFDNAPNTTLHWAGTNGGVFTDRFLSYPQGITSPTDILGIMCTAGVGSRFIQMIAATGAEASSPLYPNPAWPQASRIAWAGMGYYTSNATPDRVPAGIRYLDFIRLRTGNMMELCSSGQWVYP